jgi:hypothetical protein
MNKLTLLGFATQPKYDDDDQWTGATIFANIEAEVEEDGQICLHRVGIKLEISPRFANMVKDFGYCVIHENYLMKRVEACLNVCPKKWPGTERDANTIYEVMRLKMPRFVAKSVDRIFYSQNFRTGEIEECTEDMLDRKL